MANIPELYRESIGIKSDPTEEQVNTENAELRAAQAEASRWEAWRQDPTTFQFYKELEARVLGVMLGIAELTLRIPTTEDDVIRAKLCEVATLNRILVKIRENGKYPE